MAKGNWRDGVAKELSTILKKEGLQTFLGVASEMLSVDAGGAGIHKSKFVGEVCEQVILGVTNTYIKSTGKTASCFSSVVLKDLDAPNSDFRTELDFVLVSPGFILTTECKSYSGSITITGNGTFKHKGMSNDVYSQNVLHHKYLYKYGQQLSLPSHPSIHVPVFANAFVFSNASIDDKRTADCAKRMRVHTTSTLLDFYEQMFKKYSKPVFDYEKACKVMKASSTKKLHREHASFVGY